jgi:hypothetical protein
LIPAEVAAEIARLAGQEIAETPDGYVIEDVAGEGKPLVGVVERRGQELWLVGDVTVKLVGPLAHPRIAGPGYKVWVLGEKDGDGYRARRLGVLRNRP